MIPIAHKEAYLQFGNSVVVPLVKAVASAIVQTIEVSEKANPNSGLAKAV